MTDARTPGHRFATLYDTAKRCLIILDDLYSDLHNHIDTLSGDAELSTKRRVTVRLYECVFSIIDFAHRFAQIVDAMPLLPKKRPEVRQLHDVTRRVELCRNYVQHIRSHLSKVESIDFPILGSISWIAGNRNYVLFPTQITERYGVPGIAYDTQEQKYVHRFQFTIETHTIGLDPLYDGLKTFWKWLESVAHLEPPEVMTYEWGGPNILFSEFRYGGEAT